MRDYRRLLTVGMTFVVAAVTGYLMQHGDVVVNWLAGIEPEEDVGMADRPAPAGKLDVASVTPLSAETSGEGPALLPSLPGSEPVALGSGHALGQRMAALERGYKPAPSAADAAYDPFGLSCAAPVLTLAAYPPALIDVNLGAACHGSERVTLRHAGLSFTMRTDANGALSVLLPALDASGEVTVELEGNEKVSARVTVPDLAQVSRLAVEWRGASGFALDIYEDGADYGSAGHVRASAPGKPGKPDSGFLLLLGDASVERPTFAQVYTAPSALPVTAELSAEIAEDTCGRLLSGSLLTSVGGRSAGRDVSFLLPACGTEGDLAVMGLGNPFDAAALAVADASTGTD